MIKAIGVIGTFLLLIRNFPEIRRSYRKGKCKVGHGLLWTWFLGEILVAGYVAGTTMDMLLIFKGLFTALTVGVLIYFKYFGRRVR